MAGDFLSEQMARLAANWRSSAPPVEDRQTMRKEFERFYKQWGEGKFRATVDKCISNHSTGFFPTIAEFSAFETAAPGALGTCPICANDRDEAPKGYVSVIRRTEHGKEYECLTRCTHGRPA